MVDLFLITLATHNTHKSFEISEFLRGHYGIVDLNSLENIPKIEETGDSFQANSQLKALAVSQFTDTFVLADDSGLWR